MRKVVFILVAVAVASVVAPTTVVAQAGGECDFPVDRVDATGTTVEVDAEPDRVVTLNPSAAQTMWEIGAREKVVGATKYASNLDGFDDVHNISGAGQTINNEEVVALSPDLVLAPNTVSEDTVETLRNTGLTVYRFREAESIADITDKTRLVGRLTGECVGAEDTVAWIDERLAVVDEAVESVDRPRVIYVFYGYTSGENTFIDGVLERAGGENVAATAGIDGYQVVSEEIIVQQDPEWIVLNDDWDEVPDSSAYDGTTAVQSDQVVVVNTNQLNRPAPRVVEVVETLTETFHPDAYAAANGSVNVDVDLDVEVAPDADTGGSPTTDSEQVQTTEDPPTTEAGTDEPPTTDVGTEQSPTTDAETEESPTTDVRTEGPQTTDAETEQPQATDGGADGTPAPDDATTGADGPGFGVAVALVGIVVALLGGVRRRR